MEIEINAQCICHHAHFSIQNIPVLTRNVSFVEKINFVEYKYILFWLPWNTIGKNCSVHSWHRTNWKNSNFIRISNELAKRFLIICCSVQYMPHNQNANYSYTTKKDYDFIFVCQTLCRCMEIASTSKIDFHRCANWMTIKHCIQFFHGSQNANRNFEQTTTNTTDISTAIIFFCKKTSNQTKLQLGWRMETAKYRI